MAKKCDLCAKRVNDTELVTACRACCVGGGGRPVYIVNGLLTYVSSYQNATPLSIKTAVSCNFDSVAVEEAKRDLLNGIQHLNIEIGDAGTIRQNSINRSAKEANLDDILQIFSVIDQTEIDENNLPIFCAQDLTKVPLAPPEASANMLSIYDIISRQEKQMMTLINELASVKKEVAEMKSVPAVRTAYSVAAATPPVYVGAPAARAKESRGPAPGPSRGDEPGEPFPELSRRAEPNTMTRDKDGFQLVDYKKKKVVGTNKSQARKGAADKSDILVAGPSKFTVQITNINPEKEADDIKNYITAQDANMKILDISDTSTAGWNTKRFLVTFEMTSYEKVMSDDFWPSNIYFRQWHEARPKRQQQQSAL